MFPVEELLAQKDQNFAELKAQLNKDLQMSGIDTGYFEEATTPEAWLRQLSLLITDLLQYHTEAFDRLMYRIDISEKILQQLNEAEFSTLTEHITYLIVKREIQKLVFKKQFGT